MLSASETRFSGPPCAAHQRGGRGMLACVVPPRLPLHPIVHLPNKTGPARPKGPEPRLLRPPRRGRHQQPVAARCHSLFAERAREKHATARPKSVHAKRFLSNYFSGRKWPFFYEAVNFYPATRPSFALRGHRLDRHTSATREAVASSWHGNFLPASLL